MADRIMAAMEYLDAHTSVMLHKHKHRSLGDIDAKYDVIDPTELPLSKLMNSSVNLFGTTRINPSKQENVDMILDQDRQTISRSAKRSKSAASTSYRRLVPPTYGQHLPRSESCMPSSRTSMASVKKLSFTSPALSVRPTDVRDEVMAEIVNKPLTHLPSSPSSAKQQYKLVNGVRNSKSAPALRQDRLVRVDKQSFLSLKHAKTTQLNRQPKNWDDDAGPFATLRVRGNDLWLVSSSTPTTYFNADNEQYLNGSPKHQSWESTTEAIPCKEKASPPRHERQLGEPPQFGNQDQWYSFSGKDMSKQRPVLTTFADGPDGANYYSIESKVGYKVAQHIQNNPGIRIGINGNIVSYSMKIDEEHRTKKRPNSVETDEDEASEFESKHDIDGADDMSEVEGNNQKNNDVEQATVTNESEEAGLEEDPEAFTTEGNENLLTEGENIDSGADEPGEDGLLRYASVAYATNPYAAASETSTETSSLDLTEVMLNMSKNKQPQQDAGADVETRSQSENELGLYDDDGAWGLFDLSNLSPNLWVTRDDWLKERRRTASRRIKTAADDRAKKLRVRSSLPLGSGQHDKVILGKTVSNEGPLKPKESSSSVVFNKLVSPKHLQYGFVHLTKEGYKAHSNVTKVDTDLNLCAPSKGLLTSGATWNAYDATTTTVIEERELHSRPFTVPTNKNRSNMVERDTVNFSKFIKSPQDPVPLDHFNSAGLNDVSEEEMRALRDEADSKMKMTGREEMKNAGLRHHASSLEKSMSRSNADKAVTLNMLPMKTAAMISTVDIRPSVPTSSSVPVSSLNLSDLDESYNVGNGSNPPPVSPTSKPGKEIEAGSAPNNIYRRPNRYNGLDAPTNSPKTPASPQPIRTNQLKGRDGVQNSSRVATASKPFQPRAKSGSGFLRPSNNNAVPSRGADVVPMNSEVTGARESTSTAARMFRGFPHNPLTVNRTPGTKLMAGSSPRTNKNNLAMGAENRYTDLLAKSGFIQISRSLHVPSRKEQTPKPVRDDSAPATSSYQQELLSRGAPSSGARTAPVNRRFGATNAPFSSPVYTYLSATASQPSPASSPRRRSGLAMTPEQSNRQQRTRPGLELASPSAVLEGEGLEENSPLFNLRGDPVRLNLDKNIHVIYRDLGIGKKSTSAQLHTPRLASQSPQNSGTAEHAATRKSSASNQRDPGASRRPTPETKGETCIAADDDDQSVTASGHVNKEVKSAVDRHSATSTGNGMHAVSATSNAPSSDFGTQYQPPSADGDDDIDHVIRTTTSPENLRESDANQNESVELEASEINIAELSPNSLTERATDNAKPATGQEMESVVAESTSAVTIINAQNEVDNSQEIATARGQESSENLDKHLNASPTTSDPQTSEESSGTKTQGEKNNAEISNSVESQPTLIRSVSDSRLLPINQDAGADQETAQPDDEDVEIRGVTKVTVNIGGKSPTTT